MNSYCLFPRTPFLFSSLNVQKSMLQDAERVAKFRQAIFANVKKGDVVVDIGSGTGILAIWAAQAGAKKVYAIEETDIADIAAAIVRQNGLDHVIEVHRANSSSVTLEEKADVLTAELVGHFVFEEGMIEFIADVRDQLLKPQARIIPAGADLYLAPVQMGDAFTEVSYWSTWKDPDLSPVAEWAANSVYVEKVQEDSLLAAPAVIANVDFASARPGDILMRFSFTVEKAGMLDALAGWFTLCLDNDIRISTAPGASPTHWQQTVLPLRQPVAVQPGDRVAGEITIERFRPGSAWRWSLSVDGCGGESHECHVTYGGGFRLRSERF